MKELFEASLAPLAAPLRGLRVLLFGFSGAGFPGGDGVAEAIEALPRVGVQAVHCHDTDPQRNEKLAATFDVAIICNTRVGAVLAAPQRLWQAGARRVYWFWDLRPGSVAKDLRGRVDWVFLSYSGAWASPNGIRYEPAQWSSILGCPVGYAPQASPLRTPVQVADAPRMLFVGDLANPTYHSGRTQICRTLGATVRNARDRAGRLAIEAQLPALYRSARYSLSMSPRAPGYTSVRTYSILACGGLMVLHRFPGAERLFTDGQHAVLFDRADDIVPRLAEIDGNEAERQRIAENGRRLHAQKHTVAHRVLSICGEVMGTSKGFNGWL